HLTEYFLILSVGGALGGIFNALIAPVIFVGVAEYPIAIAVAALLRPTEKPNGWFDDLLLSAFPGMDTWSRDTGDKMAVAFGQEPPRSNWLLNTMIDVFVGLFVYGLTLFVFNNMTSERMIGIL